MAAKSFARIHAANLVNAGILPLVFDDPADCDRLAQGERIVIDGLREAVAGSDTLTAHAGEGASRRDVVFRLALTGRQREIILAGGLLNYTGSV